MPPPNRLARPLTNSLAYSVPVPLEPGMMRPTPAAFNPRRELENLSIGLGRGVVTGMEDLKQTITQPVATAQALIEAARQIGADPRIVLDMLRAARQKAMSGSLGLGELIGENITLGMRGRRIPAMRELDVYHGTPHRFPATEANPLGEFDASKIGTGEGAQAYGHGIYLAEAPGTAEIYKRALAEDVVAVDGNRIAAKRSVDARRDPESIAVNALISAQSGQVDDPFATAMQRLGGKYGPRNEYDAKAIEVIRNWRNKGAKIEEGGVMYKADLPDEMIDRMLDWDKPFLNQSQEIKDFAKTMLPPRVYDRVLMERTGDFIEALGVYKGGKAKAAELLRQAGIPGIKYLDAGSRGQGGSGTRNFVVFPGEEKKVRILERK